MYMMLRYSVRLRRVVALWDTTSEDRTRLLPAWPCCQCPEEVGVGLHA
jgi:hypothetical protein